MNNQYLKCNTFKNSSIYLINRVLTMENATKTKINYNLASTVISGFIIGAALIILAYLIGKDPKEYPITYLICICGYILGWITAIISTPMNSSDATKISRFTGVIGTFFSGYILSKADRLLDDMFNPDHIFTTLTGGRILLFTCCFGLTFIIVFYYRQYKWKVKE